MPSPLDRPAAPSAPAAPPATSAPAAPAAASGPRAASPRLVTAPTLQGDDRRRDDDRPVLAVIGNGMVGQKLLDELVALGGHEQWRIVVFAEERRAAYDRVALSSWFDGATADDLSVVAPGFFADNGIELRLGDPVVRIDRTTKTIETQQGHVLAFDATVLATGSTPFVPPITGGDCAGTFVYRTIDDLEAIDAWAAQAHVQRGTVIGGGLLGLEAANALLQLGLHTSVVEFAPRLMPVQVDDAGGQALRRHIEALGVEVHLQRATSEVVADGGRVARLRFADDDHPDLETDLLVYSAGIRAADALARSCGLTVGERGGVLVDDTLATDDPAIFAIGECAAVAGRTYGLVAPGYDMARALARQLVGRTDPTQTRFTGADLSTKLKLLGIDVASFGDAFATTDGAREIVFHDELHGIYKKLVVDGDGSRVLGGVLVGDTSAYGTLVQMARGDMPTPEHPEALIFPDVGPPGSAAATGVGALSDAASVCSCENVTKGAICGAIADGCGSVADLKTVTKAGTGCGGCVPLVTDLLRHELAQAGVEVSAALCEHFALSRQELFDLVRVRRYTTFREVLVAHGRGRGCDICKPTIGSILASLSTGHILEGEQASLQDTNDHFLANIQKNGTYSVVPRVPGGEITPDGLITIGEVARDFGLYTKITGGQRIDLFGARVEQLPAIWTRLVDAGFESGHAYGKALRTVKSCVGETWCRYGVQDSTAMAIRLELRYRGLRAPHKLKSAVSGCSRECAEAQSKDFGVIATERGWNLYVGGNGGQRPRHAVLFAEDLDDETLISVIDRFLMFYIRTADRLQRTANWLENLAHQPATAAQSLRPDPPLAASSSSPPGPRGPSSSVLAGDGSDSKIQAEPSPAGALAGGVDYLRRVLIDDALGICAELESDMERHVAQYECEWRATVEDPERVKRFVTFVNAPDERDPTVVFVEERGQIRPARDDERVLAGAAGALRADAPAPAPAAATEPADLPPAAHPGLETKVTIR